MVGTENYSALWGRLHEVARSAPARPFLVVGDEVLTYSAAVDRAARIAKWLEGSGVRRGDRVGLWLANGPAWAVWFVALAQVGAITVPINTRMTGREAAHIVDASKCVGLIIDRWVDKHDLSERVEEVNSAVEVSWTVTYGDWPTKEPNLITAEDIENGTAPVARGRILSDIESEWPLIDRRALIMQFTSGSTGSPKGVLLGERGYLFTASAVVQRHGLEAGGRLFSGSPMFHCSGSMHAVTVALCAGATLVSMRKWDPEEAAFRIRDERCTVAHNRLPHHDLVDFSMRSEGWQLDHVVTTGSQSFLERLEDSGDVRAVSGVYGLTETCGNVSLCSADEPRNLRLTSNGHPLPQVEVQIRRGNELVADGVDGDLWVTGPNLTLGYFRNEEATAEKIQRGSDGRPWLRTGDRAYLAEGHVYFVARNEDILRVGGENFPASEVEEILVEHPAIREAAVIAVPDPRLDEVPWAYITVASANEVDQADLERFLRARLASFKVPRGFSVIAELPRTGTLKVAKRQLMDIWMVGSFGAARADDV